MTTSPYEGLPKERYWRTGVAEQTPQAIAGLYRKKFDIAKSDRIATAGSCFAQHIARHLRQRGCNVLDFEPPPPGLTGDEAQRFGFNLYSARYGNIYTARQLLQLVLEAYGRQTPSDAVWERNGRFFDALRPSVEPDGHANMETVARHREQHLQRVRRIVKEADVFVFTFGLTEAWQHKRGTVYPTAPGTIAGVFNPDVHQFKNFSVHETLTDFRRFRRFVLQRNPGVRFLVTVSPVPLTATATDDHVLAATTYSKSVLRAVCGQLKDEFPDVDYFPSYEIITAPFSRGQFFESNLRSVTTAGVEAVMRVFFEEHSNLVASPAESPTKEADEEVVCEETLLEAFGR